jgi:hypothetical protein
MVGPIWSLVKLLRLNRNIGVFMAYRWYCTWENGAFNWNDFERCLSHCKILYSTMKQAQRAANAHASKYGHHGHVYVEKVDRRRYRDWKIR